MVPKETPKMRNFFRTNKSSVILGTLEKMTKEILDTNQGKLAEVPDKVIAVSLFMAINAIVQAAVDIGIEIFSFIGLLPKLPFRFEFLCLAVISAILGQFTLMGLRKRELDVTKNSLILSLFVEIALLSGDIIFVFITPGASTGYLFLRLPFMAFTAMNVIIVLYIIWRTHIFRTRKYPLKF
jgi:hypothetical protein